MFFRQAVIPSVSSSWKPTGWVRTLRGVQVMGGGRGHVYLGNDMSDIGRWLYTSPHTAIMPEALWSTRDTSQCFTLLGLHRQSAELGCGRMLQRDQEICYLMSSCLLKPRMMYATMIYTPGNTDCGKEVFHPVHQFITCHMRSPFLASFRCESLYDPKSAISQSPNHHRLKTCI